MWSGDRVLRGGLYDSVFGRERGTSRPSEIDIDGEEVVSRMSRATSTQMLFVPVTDVNLSSFHFPLHHSDFFDDLFLRNNCRARDSNFLRNNWCYDDAGLSTTLVFLTLILSPKDTTSNMKSPPIISLLSALLLPAPLVRTRMPTTLGEYDQYVILPDGTHVTSMPVLLPDGHVTSTQDDVTSMLALPADGAVRPAVVTTVDAAGRTVDDKSVVPTIPTTIVGDGLLRSEESLSLLPAGGSLPLPAGTAQERRKPTAEVAVSIVLASSSRERPSTRNVSMNNSSSDGGAVGIESDRAAAAADLSSFLEFPGTMESSSSDDPLAVPPPVALAVPEGAVEATQEPMLTVTQQHRRHRTSTEQDSGDSWLPSYDDADAFLQAQQDLFSAGPPGATSSTPASVELTSTTANATNDTSDDEDANDTMPMRPDIPLNGTHYQAFCLGGVAKTHHNIVDDMLWSHEDKDKVGHLLYRRRSRRCLPPSPSAA